MNWRANGRASMPCDAPISVEFDIQTPPRNSPSLLPLTHQHRLKFSYGSYTFKLKMVFGPARKPQANARTVLFRELPGGSERFSYVKRRCRDGDQGDLLNTWWSHAALYTHIPNQTTQQNKKKYTCPLCFLFSHE